MKKIHVALLMGFVVLNVADVALTLYAVNFLGLGEKNPFIRWIWSHGWSYAMFKAFGIIVMVGLMLAARFIIKTYQRRLVLLSEKRFHAVLAAYVLYQAYILVKNLSLIFL